MYGGSLLARSWKLWDAVLSRRVAERHVMAPETGAYVESGVRPVQCWGPRVVLDGGVGDAMGVWGLFFADCLCEAVVGRACKCGLEAEVVEGHVRDVCEVLVRGTELECHVDRAEVVGEDEACRRLRDEVAEGAPT